MSPVCSGRLCSSEIVPSPVCDHTPAAQQPPADLPAVSSPAPSVTPAPHGQRDGRQHQQRVRDGAQHPAAEETPPQPHHLHRAAAAGPGEEVPETEISLHSRQVSGWRGSSWRLFTLDLAIYIGINTGLKKMVKSSIYSISKLLCFLKVNTNWKYVIYSFVCLLIYECKNCMKKYCISNPT